MTHHAVVNSAVWTWASVMPYLTYWSQIFDPDKP